MEKNKIIQGIEKDFLEGAGIVSLCGYKDFNELNNIKQELENKNYNCQLRHELYIHNCSWPYSLTISKPVKFTN